MVLVVGPPGFEPGSIAPEATSLDQASRGPQEYGFLSQMSSMIFVGLALTLAVTGVEPEAGSIIKGKISGRATIPKRGFRN